MNEWPSNWISDSAQVSALIEKWRGATAQAWAYSVSHSQLLVRVHWDREPVEIFSLFVYFKGCSRVAFRDTWREFNLQVSQTNGQFGSEFEVSDGDHLSVRCSSGPFVYETETFLKLPGI